MTEEVPEGWTSATLGSIVNLNPPKPTADALSATTPVSFVPMPAVDADSGRILNPQVRPFGEVRKGYTAFADGDVLLAKITPCFENGKAAVASGLREGLGFGSSEFHVLRPTAAVLSEYLFHYVRQPQFREVAADHMTGTVGQERVPADYVRNIDVPLPPLAEQRRIVAKVEALLEQVSGAQDRVAKVPPILKRFRQAVLAAACSGNLTERWRATHVNLRPLAENGNHRPDEIESPLGELQLPGSWSLVRAASLIDSSFYGPRFGAAQYVDQGVPTIRTTDIDHRGHISLENAPRLGLTAKEIEKFGLVNQDLLVTRTGATIGKCALYSASLGPAIPSAYLIRFRLKKELVRPTYVLLFLQSPAGQRLLGIGQTSVAQPNINAKTIGGFPIPLPSLDEQDRIIHEVSTLFTVSDQIETRLASVLARIERVPQAILSKAFSGELVPTEAETARAEGRQYECAPALLARLAKAAVEEARQPNRRREGW